VCHGGRPGAEYPLSTGLCRPRSDPGSRVEGAAFVVENQRSLYHSGKRGGAPRLPIGSATAAAISCRPTGVGNRPIDPSSAALRRSTQSSASHDAGRRKIQLLGTSPSHGRIAISSLNRSKRIVLGGLAGRRCRQLTILSATMVALRPQNSSLMGDRDLARHDCLAP
jgi:hypothetical protein